MLALERPKRLLLGYLVGATVTSVTCGLILVFALPSSSASSTAKHTVNPARRPGPSGLPAPRSRSSCWSADS